MNRCRSLRHITVVLALCFVLPNEVTSQTRADESQGTAIGSVLDQNGAVVLMPKPVVIFKSNNNVKKVTVNNDGRFNAILPAGIYDVTTDIPTFYPYRRASFRVLEGASIMINLVPTPRYLVRGTSVSKQSPNEVAPRPKYDQFQVTTKSALSALIQFENKQNVGRNVRYKWATFTYDHITIYADELILNRKALRIVASGKRVILENGKERIEVKGVAVSFNGDEAQVEIAHP